MRAPGPAPQVWICDARELESQGILAEYPGLLDTEERERLTRLRHRSARLLFLVSHALTRSVLGACLGEDPRALVFQRDPHGKPWLCRAPCEPTLAFNLSHSGSLAALAVAPLRLEPGVDVEAHRGGRRFEALARRYFSVPEQRALSGAPPSELAGRFYDTWTLKEAWLKARGSGIRVPLADFGFDRQGELLAFSATAALEPKPAHWRFWCWRLGEQASLSLAIRDPGRVSGSPLIHRGVPLGNWEPLALEVRAASQW